MRYLPKNKNDTYNYASPTISDKSKKMVAKIAKKIFTPYNIFIAIYYMVLIAAAIGIFLALLPLYAIFYAAIGIIILSLLSA